MKPPIFIIENGDISVFESVAKAQLCLEPIDVKNDEYRGYDSEGRPLAINTKNTKHTSFFGWRCSVEKVEISATDETSHGEGELKSILIDYIKRIDIFVEFDEVAVLSILVEKMIEKIGYTE